MKITNIEMEWTDTGAKIITNSAGYPAHCPVCDATITPNVQHLCGEFAEKPVRKPARRKSA